MPWAIKRRPIASTLWPGSTAPVLTPSRWPNSAALPQSSSDTSCSAPSSCSAKTQTSPSRFGSIMMLPIRGWQPILSQGMLDHQFMDELLDAFLRGRDLSVARLGQDDRLDAEDLGRRAGQSAAIEVRTDAIQIPLLQEQALLLEVFHAALCFGCQRIFCGAGHQGFGFREDFRWHAGPFQPHDAARGRRARFVSRLDDRHQQRQRPVDDFPAVAEISADLHPVAL